MDWTGSIKRRHRRPPSAAVRRTTIPPNTQHPNNPTNPTTINLQQNAKNALEAHIYALRNRLYEGLAPFVKEADRDALAATLSKLEDWLYEDGEDETKSVYVAKLQVRC